MVLVPVTSIVERKFIVAHSMKACAEVQA